MASHSREQLEAWVDRWLQANKDCEKAGDWRPLGDFYAPEATYGWNIGPKDSMFARYSYGSDNLVTTSRLPNLPAGFGSGSNPTSPWAAVLEETHLFSSNLVNEFRIGLP